MNKKLLFFTIFFINLSIIFTTKTAHQPDQHGLTRRTSFLQQPTPLAQPALTRQASVRINIPNQPEPEATKSSCSFTKACIVTAVILTTVFGGASLIEGAFLYKEINQLEKKISVPPISVPPVSIPNGAGVSDIPPVNSGLQPVPPVSNS